MATGSVLRRATLQEARDAVADARWRDAYAGLSELDARSGLAAEELELLATASYLCGHAEEGRQARLRAYQVLVNTGAQRRAARCAAWVGLHQLDAGEIAEASGCLPATMSSCAAWAGQASALLGAEEEEAEHGLMLIPLAYEQLVMMGDADGAARTAARAVAIGRRTGDGDVLGLALVLAGRAAVRSGRIQEGTALLDDAVTVIASGDVSVPVAGLVLTSAIDASQEAADLGRFDEWARLLAGWCDRQQGMVAFRSRSLVHLAMLSQLRGRWDEALQLARRAGEAPFANADPSAAAAAAYREGEILRLRGALADAEAAYGRAHRLGFDPQPGLALLRLEQGDAHVAATSIGRALVESRSHLDRIRLLPAQVEILLATDASAEAAAAAGEMARIAASHGTPALHARAQQATGAVLLAQNDAAAALIPLREAAKVWHHFDAPYEEARVRTLIARSCVMLGDSDAAALEVDLARELFARLGAAPGLLAVESVLPTASVAPHGLTPREMEVLRLLATGLTNREIAHALVVTVRTVETHVGSILGKLGVSSRAAATSFAHRHRLV
jgi:DNA-binding NarL/FixJ family response regulator